MRRGATGRSRRPFLRRCRELEAKTRLLESASAVGQRGAEIRDPPLPFALFHQDQAGGRGRCSYFLPLGGQAKGRVCKG